MKKNKIKTLALLLCCLSILLVSTLFWALFTDFSSSKEQSYIYIGEHEEATSVYAHLRANGSFCKTIVLQCMSKISGYERNIRAGRYSISPGISTLALFRNLRNGHQAPVQLVISTTRTLNDLAQKLSTQLATDSTIWATTFADTVLCAQFGYTRETLPCLFIPNTYEVFWNITPENLLKRMQKENKAFWTDSRHKAAKAVGLTEHEVITLASIIEQETANNAEKPMIAGMYLNRLHQGMKLQADPTVKFALQNFALRRIMHEHLMTNSPYNTYLYKGLPPGPICIPSIASIEAVLHPSRHNYLYMCAKEDFSGTHNFTVTYTEHLENARRYTNALNTRNIH